MDSKLNRQRKIDIIEGDIFDSCADVILHQVNCQGVMGSGIARQVKQRYPAVFKAYKSVCDEAKKTGSTKQLLGTILACEKTNSLTQNLIDNQIIVNLFAQDRYGTDKCYTDYDALKECLKRVNSEFEGLRVGIPYHMSCGRAGGDWDIVDKIIKDTLVWCDVTYYLI